jgi:hypothetical protein
MDQSEEISVGEEKVINSPEPIVPSPTLLEPEKTLEPPKPKRRNQKRKHLVEPEQKIEGGEQQKTEQKPEQTIEEQKDPIEQGSKRVRITTEDDQTEQEEPSFWRGGLIKPLLIAGIASASFYVNNIYNTKKTIPTPTQPPQKKKTIVPSNPVQNFMFNRKTRPSLVPGFTS